MKEEPCYLLVDKRDVCDFELRIQFRKELKEARKNKQNVIIIYDEVSTLENLIDNDRYIFDSEGQIDITFAKIPENWTKLPPKDYFKNHKIS